MTIDTLFEKRLYLLIILELKSRRIVRYDLTEHPTREFVRQRIIEFSEVFEGQKTLIYDNALQFTEIDFTWYGINGVSISPFAPNMNSYTERVIGSIRRETLDHFLLISRKQVLKIIAEYVEYYNTMRPHQGIGRIPDGKVRVGDGDIKKRDILGGFHHHYFKSSA